LDESKILEDQKILDTEFEGSSDRSAAIVGVSYLDELLKEVVLECMVKDTSNVNKQLFSNNGPLSSFSSRIDLSYRFGVISKYEKSQLHILRKIRNIFAHMLVGASFENEGVKQQTLNTSVPIEMLTPRNIPFPQHDGDIPELPIIVKARKDNPRAIFQETVIHLSLLLRARQLQSFSNPIQQAKPFSQATEPGEIIGEYWKSLRLKYEKLLEEVVAKGGTVEESDEVSKKPDLLFRVNDYCNEQTKKAHAVKNYA
jgi:DNA-binding MltR family transcriptional regulator